VLSLVDVFVLEPAIWSQLNTAAWVPVDHDPAPPRCSSTSLRAAPCRLAMSRFGEKQLRDFDPLYVRTEWHRVYGRSRQ